MSDKKIEKDKVAQFMAVYIKHVLNSKLNRL